MKRAASLLIVLAFVAAPVRASGVTNNDSSCDIGLFPAATLLLPYFEVDLRPGGHSTIFSITNVSALPQIAQVTLWSDWAYPVVSFSIFLSGYDVQPINLFDILVRGEIAPPNGTSVNAPNARDRKGQPTNPYRGMQPLRNLSNPNFLPGVANDCAVLPGPIPAPLLSDIQGLLTRGQTAGNTLSCPLSNGQQAQVGTNHGGTTAIGYATIDVVATCSRALPTELAYFTSDLLFDNVLTGDYVQIISGTRAEGGPLVHIRAVPEGGGAGTVPDGVTDLPFTFYDRYTFGARDRRIDRRQPLPSTFGARWLSSGIFSTSFEIWREGFAVSASSCEEYIINSAIPIVEVVRFDERENTGVATGIVIGFYPPTTFAAQRIEITSALFPAVPGSVDVGGWVYFNLSNGGNRAVANLYDLPPPYATARAGFGAGGRDVSQNWVRARMSSSGTLTFVTDAASLGNGCSPASPATWDARDVDTLPGHIGPSGGVVICPPGTVPTNGDRSACIGTNVTP